ncbi:hypothetical protein [Amphritea sp. HPY]|uniref:hypothetical protein n=1 Tax=Amphritea sp. HPY TaxID=3421652 RepID=UPI003D7C9582
MNNKYGTLISRYIKAKDDNKPHLMKSVFSEDATLRMKVKTENISFPSDVTGLNEITETLVREFNKSYENIYTICLSDTVEQHEDALNCRWIVGMTEKASGLSRVGFGDYQWCFESEGSNLVSHLTIVIEDMIILPRESQSDVMYWFDNLSYPWALSSKAVASMPDVALLAGVRGLVA